MASMGEKEAVAELYDKVTSNGILEELFGEHLHDGYYEVGTVATISAHRVAVVRIIDEALRFADVFTDDQAKKPRNMLDVGCGKGGTCVHMARKYDIQCTGISISPDEIQCAKHLAASQGLENKVSFDVGDALNMRYSDGSFELIFVIQCIEHIQDKEKFIREIVRVAAPGAQIVIISTACRNLSPSEKSLKPKEEKTLKKICNYLHLSGFCSLSDYSNWLTPLPIEDMKIADWTQNAAPFYTLLLREAFSIKGFISLLMNGGWTAVKVILGMKTIHEAIENDLLKIVAVTFRKTK
ncbi:hypothetical protein M9H77_33642 [Catharanthus roseus]|uniref:Uncharacterized protein n=1 Tax=Catharanthus roseus TaxID=4058 RepID=A0ACB9ZL39_CATRO|nr:hypothetical protein M9H77_33642 [Catharanthus roseus]